MLLNLLSNAARYNRSGGAVNVSLSTDGALRRLTVRVSGAEISSEDLDRLFVPFDRLGDETKGPEGAGLGLALSKTLIEAMGGTIEVSSEVASGVRSTFAFPRWTRRTSRTDETPR